MQSPDTSIKPDSSLVITLKSPDSMPVEVLCARPQDAAQPIADHVRNVSIIPRLVRVEGVMLAGKSSLAEELAAHLDPVYVEADCFRPFASPDDLQRFQDALRDAISKDRWVVVDSVRLNEIAPEHEFGRGFQIYVRRSQTLAEERVWRYGYDIDNPASQPVEDESERLIRLYHRMHRPHETADLVVTVPDEERGGRAV